MTENYCYYNLFFILFWAAAAIVAIAASHKNALFLKTIMFSFDRPPLPGAVDHDCWPNPAAFIDRRRLAYNDHGSQRHDCGGRPVPAGTRVQEFGTKRDETQRLGI